MATVLLLLLTVSTARAQVVEGRVLDEQTGAPIEGAVVVLLNDAQIQLQAVLTSNTGLFQFSVADIADYSLRAEMIGRQSVTLAPVQMAPGFMHDLRLPARAIRLAGLEVTGETRCSGELQSARSIYAVWTEVEKALRATEVTRAASTHRFRIAEYDRIRQKRSMRLLEETASEEEVAGGEEPFFSLPPDEVESDGYIRDEDGYFWIYGPTTAVLLSRGFQVTHCFSLHRDRSRPGLVGLAFEPVEGRDVPDINGVLWIDEDSAELRTLDFEYQNLPQGLMRGEYTGAAEFSRLSDGAWMIARWWLRSPDPRNLRRIREQAGEVLAVDGRVIPGSS